MIKKLAIIMSVITVSVLLHGMKPEGDSQVIQLKNLKRTGTAQGSGSHRQQEVTESKPDVKLNFDTLPEPLFSSSNGKPSVKSLNHVKNLKSQQTTYRVSTGRGSNDTPKDSREMMNQSNELRQPLIVKNNNDQQDNFLDINDGGGVGKRSSVGTTKRRSVLEQLTLDKDFSSEDMWNMVKKINPQLYEYAQTNQLSLNEVMDCPYNFEVINPTVRSLLNQLAKKKSLPLDEMMEYVHLLDNFNIEPEALGQLLQQQHKISDVHTALLVKKFKDIQEKDGEKYIGLALDFITRTCDESGLKEPSPIHAAHVAIQTDTISEQKSQIWYQYAALAVTLITTLGGYAWAIYGQVSGTATNAPTNAPTNTPTYAPTFAPV